MFFENINVSESMTRVLPCVFYSWLKKDISTPLVQDSEMTVEAWTARLAPYGPFVFNIRKNVGAKAFFWVGGVGCFGVGLYGKEWGGCGGFR